MKRRVRHNQHFPEFQGLVSPVEEALVYLASQLGETKSLIGLYVESLVALPVAA